MQVQDVKTQRLIEALERISKHIHSCFCECDIECKIEDEKASDIAEKALEDYRMDVNG